MTVTIDQDVTADSAAAEGVAGRLFEAGLGAAELYTVALGLDVGLYRRLADVGASSAADLAAGLGLDERYVREWCNQQAIAGFLTTTDTEPRTYALAEGVATALLDETHPAYLGALAHVQEPVSRALPQLVAAFRTGAGVPMADYGQRLVDVQGAFNRPAYVHSLAAEWVPGVPGLLERLSDATRPARVVDVGCGVGWSAIELAKAFPAITVHGYDADEASIAAARRNAAEAGVTGRVRFEVVGSGTRTGDTFDVAFFFECVHDMAHPTDVLRQVRDSLASDGFVVVMDERVDEGFQAPGDEIQRFLAACSVVWCLPQSRTDAQSEAIGTLMRASDLARIAADAGYSRCEPLDIEHMMFRFYQLVP